MGAILKLRDIKKDFSGVSVLEGICFEIQSGKVYSLAGENGAGKSTMCNIIIGSLEPSSGEIELEDGSIHKSLSIDEAKAFGIRMVHQELLTLPDMTIAENLFVGNECRKYGFVQKREMNKKAEEILKNVGLNVDPRTFVRNLDIASRQLVEIAKAVRDEAKLIILDEPTSSLSEPEIEKLFRIIRRYKENGTSFVFISHRIDEILNISDEILVLKDGEMTAQLENKEVTAEMIISKMVGRSYSNLFCRERKCYGDEVLRVSNLSAATEGIVNNAYQPAGIQFTLHKGEVLGLAGLVGAGRTEILRLLFGDLDKKKGSEIYIEGKPAEIHTPSDAIHHGIGMVTEDRKGQGVILDFPIRDNVALPNLKNLARGMFVVRREERKLAETYIEKLNIKTTGFMQRLRYLSGGNQQKIVLAKWLASTPKILLLDEPTRGIDVGAKSEIYKLINELTETGMAILVVSSELPEIMGISDRILVIHEGQLAGEVKKEEFSEERIMTYATGKEVKKNEFKSK